MSRWRDRIVLALLLTPAVFVCGKLLLTPMYRLPTRFDPPEPTIVNTWSFVEQLGWPLIFTDTYSVDSPMRPAVSLYFSVWRLLADLVVLFSAIAIIGLLFARHRRQLGRWLRFSLAECFFLLTLLGIVLGSFHYQYRQWRTARVAAEQLEAHGWKLFLEEHRGPEWLLRFLPEGATIFRYPTELDTGDQLQPPQLEGLANALKELRYVEAIELDYSADADPVLAEFAQRSPLSRCDPESMCKLERVRLLDSAANDEAAQAVGRMQNLRELTLDPRFDGNDERQCKLSDRALGAIANCQSLEMLTIDGSLVTDAGMLSIAKLHNLRLLHFSSPQLTDESIESILKIKTLEELSLAGCTRLTDRGVRRLVELPQLSVLCLPSESQFSPSTIELLKQKINSVEFIP